MNTMVRSLWPCFRVADDSDAMKRTLVKMKLLKNKVDEWDKVKKYQVF